MFPLFFKKHALGIDVSDTGVKMLLLTHERRRITVAGFSEARFPRDAHCDGRIANARACGDIIAKAFAPLAHLVQSHDTATTASLADTHTQMAMITLPAVSVTHEHVLEETAKHIPLHPETTLVDWQIVERENDNATIFVITAPRSASDDLATALGAVGCFPGAIESEAIALARLFAAEEPEVIIDWGESRTILLLCRNRIPVFTIALPLTGHNFTEAIAATLRLPLAEAEATKRRCGFDQNACNGALREIINDHMNTAVQKIRMGLDAAAVEGHAAPTHITLAGGGAHLPQIDAMLTHALSIPVARGNLWTHIAAPKNFPDHALSYAVALGLACRTML